MPKGFIMIRKKVGDDEKVLLDLIHSSPRFRVLLVTDDEEILSIIESIMKSEEPLRFSFF